MKKILLVLIIIVLLIAVIFFTGGSLNKNISTVPTESVQKEESGNDVNDLFETTPTATILSGIYTNYSMSQLTDNTNIIFFAARWCPSCQTLDNDILKNIKNIPPSLTILKVDYDLEQDLRIKYGVTIQHTLVQVDKEGNELNKWNGLYNLSTLEDVLNLI